MDNLSGILAFVRSAEARNFTKAAHQLGMTPSGVSKAISRLENQFKVRLLHRTSRSVTMTSEGVRFYERCRQILADLEDAEQLLSQARGAPRGMLRITLPLSVGRLHLVRAIPEFVQRYPEITVEASFTDRLVDLIEEGYDVAMRMGKPPDLRVVARQLTVGTLTTCAAPAYLKRHGTPRTPEDLAGHNCIRFVLPSTGRGQDWKFQRDGKRFSVAVSGNLALDHAEALVEGDVSTKSPPHAAGASTGGFPGGMGEAEPVLDGGVRFSYPFLKTLSGILNCPPVAANLSAKICRTLGSSSG